MQTTMAVALTAHTQHPVLRLPFLRQNVSFPPLFHHKFSLPILDSPRYPLIRSATNLNPNPNPNPNPSSSKSVKTCKNCKTQFDPSLNHPRACSFHTAHFGGETKRKFESVYSGGTMDTPGSGRVLQYWHCCGSEDPFDPGCTAAPHSSYDD